MRKGWLLELRARRLGVIQWIMAVMLLPSLLGLLSTSQLTPEAALARDLGQSICSLGLEGTPEDGVPTQNSDHGCGLCIMGCATHCASPAVTRTISIRFPAASPVPPLAERDVSREADFAFAGPSPRGPPAIS